MEIKKTTARCSCNNCEAKNYGEEKKVEEMFEISFGPISFFLCPSCFHSLSLLSTSFLRGWIREKEKESKEVLKEIWEEERK